ncbi:hypothetical protein MSAN_00888200 [Mycena sanguinolenta]|uniref:HD domain-containing protein n=1 Tax=Mycena sanguinolenta TaxID=230812 RepID=A0A8H6YYV0_9AGAR|nr:hypothetical protein MSAN_00888200 [Mycena sanguinolenta]
MPFPKTFDAYVPSNTMDLFGLAKIKPDYVPFETLRSVPLDPAHTTSLEYAKKITPPGGISSLDPLLLFCPRDTPQWLSVGDAGGRLYHTCILHDLGWTTTTEGMEHPAAGMTFELHGGIMAYEHLHAAAPELDAQQVGDIVQSIVLHSSQWPSGKSSATKTLISLSAFFDVCGYDAQGPRSMDFLINRKTVQEIEKEYPRGNFASELEEFLKVIHKEPLVPVNE